jgi:hypothetical protein
MNLQQIALLSDIVMAKVVYAHDEGHVVTSEDRDEGEYAHCLDAVMALSAGMDSQQVADTILVKVVYGGREGAVVTSEDRDHHEYGRCLDAAQAILDGMGLALQGGRSA